MLKGKFCSVFMPRHSCIPSVKQFGAIGDGIIDDTAAIQTAINKCLSVCIPRGQYRVTRPLKIPSGAAIIGAGIDATIIKIPNDASFYVFDMDSKTSIHISNFFIKKESGNPDPPSHVKAYGIEVRGSSTDILIENIFVDGCFRAFNIAGGEGDDPGIVKRITLRDCVATHSILPTKHTGQYGFNIDDCDLVTLINCHAKHHWLDGLKL